MYEAVGATTGTVDELAEHFKNNKIVAIAPGGQREAFFSDEYYTIMWGQRKGFAKSATIAKVVIIVLISS